MTEYSKIDPQEVAKALGAIEIKHLTSADDLNSILSECIKQKWAIRVDMRKLRFYFTNSEDNVEITVRIGSIKSYSKELINKVLDYYEQNGHK